MAGINSRDKGARGEREWAHYLISKGHEARRGVQHAGGPDSPDVVCESLSWMHFEVKRTERLSLYKAMEQAERDGVGKMPVVAHKKNRGDWLIVIKADDYFKLLDKIDIHV